MTKKQNKLLELITQAINDFNQLEGYLIKNDLSERCICAKFATYLERVIANSEFGNYFVDVEYNRGYDGKNSYAKMLDEKLIVVDLIVHKRALDPVYGYDNLICIEMKKSYKGFDLSLDKSRLQKLTNDIYGYGYEIGCMIVAERNQRANKYCLKIDETFYNSNR